MWLCSGQVHSQMLCSPHFRQRRLPLSLIGPERQIDFSKAGLRAASASLSGFHAATF
jgi:hypothetical protein